MGRASEDAVCCRLRRIGREETYHRGEVIPYAGRKWTDDFLCGWRRRRRRLSVQRLWNCGGIRYRRQKQPVQANAGRIGQGEGLSLYWNGTGLLGNLSGSANISAGKGTGIPCFTGCHTGQQLWCGQRCAGRHGRLLRCYPETG